ncbi:putative bifunctional diguanylate cyclase/phosphodiesterase [Oryzifoliimicrobium ureilyticus]|uniref:putative bifunctional diguanylate cyclase/phosphodiesterase n=1 Tax=Oryzifoliimicrobium ureilyticus TaxID=3113724 RepID=UPI0030766D9C
MLLLLILQIISFSLFPLYFTMLHGPSRRTHFYVYIAILLLIGGFMGNVYSLPLAEGIVISGGNLCYGAFMMTAVMFVWAERDAFILRHLVRLVVLVDLFNISFSYLTQTILKSDKAINTHGVPSALFEISTPLIALGGVLIILELLLLLFIFEIIKRKNVVPVWAAALYITSFAFVLVLDGIAFPLIAFGINSQIVTLVFGGLGGKIVMALAFSVPLAVFILWRRQAFVDYLEAETVRWRLLASSSTDLIREMTIKDQDLYRGDIVFRNSTEGLAIVDKSGFPLKANKAFRDMLELDKELVNEEKLDVRDFIALGDSTAFFPRTPSEHWRHEVTVGGRMKRPGILSITPAGKDFKGDETYVYSLIDIAEQKSTQVQLEYLASHDHLTGLPNRRALDKTLAGLQSSPHSLIMIDLDRFGDVNDSYGHDVGDHVLQAIATRLDQIRVSQLQPQDQLCRIGGDEFAFLLHTTDKSLLERALADIRASLDSTIEINDSLHVLVTATIGVSSSLQSRPQDIFRQADAALYEAKRFRRGSVSTYEERLTLESQQRTRLAVRLKDAIANDRLEVHYQPQFDATTHELCGAEALVRWTDPEIGIVSPADFIPIAEETGLIEAIGAFVLERTCSDGREWLRAGYRGITLSVNVSASQLRSGRFISTLDQMLKKTGFPAESLCIEITESTYLERENEVIPLLSELRNLGLGIAIDDFGTKYSSLSYLVEIPCTSIKIDRSFVSRIPNDIKQADLTSAIVKLATIMSFKVVVEGVETKAQLDFVTAEGCDMVQGFYFAGALAKSDFVERLQRAS